VKRRKSKNRVKISFAATILVLVAVTAIAYSLSFRIPTFSVPANLPPYGGLIGKYAPADALQVSYDNLTAVRALNGSAIPNTQLVNLVKPAVTVHYAAVRAQVLVTILNTALKINNTGTAAVLDTGAYANLSKALTTSNITPDQEMGYTLYQVNDSSNGRTKTEWLTLVPSGTTVVYAEERAAGSADAKTVILRMLSVFDGASPSILSVQNVTRMLYPVSGTDHLAIAIQNFTGEVQTSSMGVVTVDVSNQEVQLTHVVRFMSTGQASSQVGEVKSVYKFASDFSQWEESIKAVQSLSLTSLEEAVQLTGV
jgi:hypothetical protein